MFLNKAIVLLRPLCYSHNMGILIDILKQTPTSQGYQTRS